MSERLIAVSNTMIAVMSTLDFRQMHRQMRAILLVSPLVDRLRL
jgi:hypothetical protein